jgi:hypothetical protein
MTDVPHFDVIPEKPNLSLYLRQKVVEILKGDQPWQWAIKLESGVCIINKDESELFPPDEFLAQKNFRLESFSMSRRDRILRLGFSALVHVVKWSLTPTKYAIHDPVHGGEVYPQWPEELEEEYGIPSVEGGQASSKPSQEWGSEYKKLTSEGDERRQREAEEFLRDEDDDA